MILNCSCLGGIFTLKQEATLQQQPLQVFNQPLNLIFTSFPEPPKEVLPSEFDNKETEVKKRRSSGHSKKESDQSKSDAKSTPGTVKHTIYEVNLISHS